MWHWIDRIDSRFGIEKFKSGGIILRSRYFIPLVLILLPPMGLIIGAILAQPLSEWFPQSGITDNYEIAGVFGGQIGILCAILIVAIRLGYDLKSEWLSNGSPFETRGVAWVPFRLQSQTPNWKKSPINKIRPKATKGKIVNQNHIFNWSSPMGKPPLGLVINEWPTLILQNL